MEGKSSGDGAFQVQEDNDEPEESDWSLAGKTLFPNDLNTDAELDFGYQTVLPLQMATQLWLWGTLRRRGVFRYV